MPAQVLLSQRLLVQSQEQTRKIYESCSKLTIKTPERRQSRRSGVFIFNFEQILHIVLMFAMLTLNK